MSTAAANLETPAPFFLPSGAAAPSTEPRHVAPSDGATHPEPPSDPVDAADAPKGARKTAWNRPSNGAGEIGAVMDAAAWPPLSESARASPKSSSSESLKSLSELPPAAAPPAIRTAAESPEQPAAAPTAQAKPAAASSAAVVPARQRSMKRGGGNGNGLVANGGQVPPAAGEKPTAVEIPGREGPGKNGGGGWEHGGKPSGFSPHGHGRSEHHHRAYGGNHRKGGNGGGGGYHNGNISRQDHQDRRGHEWNPYPNFAGKNMPMSPHQRPMQRPFFQAPFTGPAAFIGPPSPVRPYGPPLGFPPEVAGPMIYAPLPTMHHDPLRGPMPFVHQPVVYIPPDPDVSKSNAILKQIEYYFSNENLCKDVYLRERMNEEGWVPVTLIANFNRVKELSDNIYFILDAVRASSVIEVQGDKIRRRNDWSTWIIRPPSNRAANLQFSDVPVLDNLAGRMRTIGLGEGTAGQSSPVAPAQAFSGSSSGEFYSQSLMAGTPHSSGSAQYQ